MKTNRYHQNLMSAYKSLDLDLDFKAYPEDFLVEEELSFSCSGEGEHFYIQIRKTQLTTLSVAEQLSKWAKVSPKNISYAGLKDKQGITDQWFSIWLPGKTLPERPPNVTGIEFLLITRHSKKLKRGSIKENRFTVRLRGENIDSELISNRLELIKMNGVPNYYGSQRFGRNQDNVDVALLHLSGQKIKRQERSILISSVRSFLYNLALSMKVKDNTWREVVTGQPLQLFGSRSWFVSEGSQEEVDRVNLGDCSPTTELYSNELVGYDTQRDAIFESFPELTDLLEKFDLKRDLRPNILRPFNLSYSMDDAGLTVKFSLLTGAYATSLLRELTNKIN